MNPLSAHERGWESLKKRLHKIERVLNHKLHEHSRWGVQIAHDPQTFLNRPAVDRRAQRSLAPSSSAAAAAPSSVSISVEDSDAADTPMSESEDENGRLDPASLSALEEELEEQLYKLRSVVEDMEGHLKEAKDEDKANHLDTKQATLKRCRSILYESLQEFSRTKLTIQSSTQRFQLMAERQKSGSTLRPRTEQLLREKSSLHSSVRATAQLIDEAESTKMALCLTILLAAYRATNKEITLYSR